MVHGITNTLLTAKQRQTRAILLCNTCTMHEAKLFIKAGHVIKNVPRGGCVKVKRAIMKVKAAYL